MADSYEDLEIYRRALELAKVVYALTKNFPKEEIFGITSQLRRAVSSIGANIAEGFGRYHYKDKTVFFYNARGSLYETRYFITLSCELDFIDKKTSLKLFQDLDILAMKLNKFIYSIGKKANESAND